MLIFQNKQGSLLDHEDLIVILKKSQSTAEEVSKRLTEAKINQEKTDQARSKYLKVASRGAVLYFVTDDLSGLSPMYKFSLQWFTKLFIDSIGECVTKLISNVQNI